ncbi:MAG: TetR family transcriptional regulator [Acidimicrobiales bacterium]
MSDPAPRSDGSPPLLPARATANGTLRRLQEVALALFAERGYHGVSMRDLATAIGVKPSSLYAHVSSKEHLLRDLVLLAHEEHRDRLRHALLESESSPACQLEAVVKAHVALHANFPLLATVANSELHALGDSSLRVVLAVRGDAERTIEDIVRRGLRLGVFECEEPWLATAAIGGMGIRVAAWYRDRSTYPVATVCEQYAHFALRIVGHKGDVGHHRS